MKFELPKKEEKKTKGLTIRTEADLVDLFTKACKIKGSDKTKILTAFMSQFVKEAMNG